MKINVLFISPQNVIPPVDGGKQSIYYPLKYLSKQYDINLYSIIILNKNETVNKNDYLNLGIKEIEFIKVNKQDRPFNLIKNIFEKLPFKWAKYVNENTIAQSITFAEKIKPHIVICSAPHTFIYGLEIKKKLNVPLILREHNIEYELLKQFYKLSNNPIYKLIGFWQYLKAKKQEIDYWRLADKVLFISESDYTIASNVKPKLKNCFYVLHDGFEKKNIAFSLKERESLSFIISIPLKSSLQNQYNLKYFISKIWSEFVKRNNQYMLYLTGNKDSEIKSYLKISKEEMNKLNIINLGFVNDIDKAIATKKYFISPTFFGSGIRLKALHALSLGMPIFLPEVDYKTVKYFKDMENVILFKNLYEFEKKLLFIDTNDSLYNTISQNAKNLIEDKLNWINYVENIRCIIKEMVKK